MYNEYLGIALIILGVELIVISLYQLIENKKIWERPVVYKFTMYSILAIIFGILVIGYGFFNLLSLIK